MRTPLPAPPLDAVLTHSAEVSLPKATVNKFANEIASSLDVRLTADTRELIAQCCSEFVQLLSSEANEICEGDSKKTITPEHVLRALKQLGLQRYLADVTKEYDKVRADDRSKGRAAAKRDRKRQSDTTELLRQQELLFAMARKDPINAANPAALEAAKAAASPTGTPGAGSAGGAPSSAGGAASAAPPGASQ